MFAGDYSRDGQATAADFNEFLVATKAGATGYAQEDGEFDAQVTAADFNIWLVRTKSGAETQVPG